MPTERDRMIAGEPYDPMDPELTAARQRARVLARAFNQSPEEDPAARQGILRNLIPDAGSDLWIEPPFHCDYGSNLHLGDRVYFNFNCVVLDVCPVRIGSRVLIGPGVQILTATHPMDAEERAAGLEAGKPIEIGDDVWIGGGAILCPGVRIGARSIIGAGSVVTRDIPEGMVAAGNPCKVIRPVGEGAARKEHGPFLAALACLTPNAASGAPSA